MAIEFNNILALLASYYIPAQSIERIMEYCSKSNSSFNKLNKMTFYQSQLDSLQKIRDQTVNQFTLTHTEINKSTNKDIEKNDPVKFYDNEIKKIDTRIGESSANSDRENTRFAIKMWEYGTLMAVAPAVLFAHFGLGILQMSGYSGLYSEIFDIVLNTLFIGSGTKPIHDAIDAIMSIKKS